MQCNHIYISRKRDKLRISRPPIRPNIILRKSLLSINAPRLIKVNPPILHNLSDFPLRSRIQASTGISIRDIGCNVELR